MPSDENEPEEVAEETEEINEQASELAVMEAIDKKYRDRQFAEKVDKLRSVKINRETLIEVKETFQAQWELYFKRSKQDIWEANKYKENMEKMDKALRVHSQDPFLQNWIHDRDEIIDHLTSANASSLQLMTLCSYLVPKLFDEIGRVYSLGTRNYLNQETKERMDQKFVELLAMGQELGYNLPEKAQQAVMEHNRLKEKIRTLSMTKAEARRQTIAKALFESILDKTDFEKKKFPTASECYADVKNVDDQSKSYAKADIIEAKDWLIKTGRLKEVGKGRGLAKRLVLQVNQFVLVKSSSEVPDKYRTSRENAPPTEPRGAFESENSQNEEADEVEDAENQESDGEPGD